jgi:prefoldin subunit 5
MEKLPPGPDAEVCREAAEVIERLESASDRMAGEIVRLGEGVDRLEKECDLLAEKLGEAQLEARGNDDGRE